MYGQMTAGLVDLHRHAGNPAGHLRVLRRDRPQALRRHAGRHDHAHRRAGRDGRRAAAGRDDERRRGAVHRRRPAACRAARRDPLPRRGRRLCRGRGRPLRARPTRAAAALSVGLVGNAADVLPAPAARSASPPTSSPTRRAPTTRSATCPTDLTPEADSELARRRSGRARPPGPRAAWPPTARRWSGSSTAAPRCSTTATACAPRPSSAASTAPSTTPGFLPAYIRPLFCEGKGPFRWVALSGDPADIAATDRAVLEEFPDDEGLHRWIHLAGERVAFQGLPARICWLGYGERHRLGLRFNEMVRTGEVSGADRDRPRPPRLRLGGIALPRDGGDGRRVRRDRRLAAAQRARQHGQRRHVGEHPPRWRRRHRPLDPRRDGGGRRRHRPRRRRSSSGCSPATRAWA